MTGLVRDLLKRSLQTFAPGVFVYRLARRDAVALTFDDGPNPEFTEKVLEILERYGHRGNFFLVGQRVEAHPGIACETHRRGHTIGSHTHSHTTLDRMSRDMFRDELRRSQDAIEEATGQRPGLLRPPEGRMKSANLIWARRAGIKLVHFTITSNDWKATSKQDVLDCIPTGRLTGGEILSFHDTNPHVVEALPEILDGLQAQGLGVVPLAGV